MPSFQAPNARSSVHLLLMHQKAPAMSQPMAQFMPQVGYASFPTMSANYQPSANFMLMNYNHGWTGQLPIRHIMQENYQVVGTQQGQI